MTPGPTTVPEPVRKVMSRQQPNPDVEASFVEQYNRVTDMLKTVYGTDDDVVVLGGEGILGLEAAIASTIEPGDQVLVIANGMYGEGFAEFVKSHGGSPEVIAAPWGQPLDVERVEAALHASEFKAATMVHVDTPTGNLNDLGPILERVNKANVLSIVDAVSSLGGTPVPTEQIDIALGASQKCFSAPTGLTTASIDEFAWDIIEDRDPESVYTNLLPWRDIEDGFPYTHLAANVAALERALELILEEGLEAVYDRHERAAERCRELGREFGLDLFPAPELRSPTVSAFHVPGRAKEIQEAVATEHGITVATGLGEMKEDVLRVGHMGYSADVRKVEQTMNAIDHVLD